MGERVFEIILPWGVNTPYLSLSLFGTAAPWKVSPAVGPSRVEIRPHRISVSPVTVTVPPHQTGYLVMKTASVRYWSARAEKLLKSKWGKKTEDGQERMREENI